MKARDENESPGSSANGSRTPPAEKGKALLKGRINHWFPLIRPAKGNPYFWGGMLEGGIG